MSEDEKATVTLVVQQAVKSAREQTAKKSNSLDKVNLAVTILALIIGPICWLLISQKIDLRVNGLESSDKDTYVDKPTFSTALTDIEARFGRQEQHIDSVDNRENSDKATEDLKIQSLQDLSRQRLSSTWGRTNSD